LTFFAAYAEKRDWQEKKGGSFKEKQRKTGMPGYSSSVLHISFHNFKLDGYFCIRSSSLYIAITVLSPLHGNLYLNFEKHEIVFMTMMLFSIV